MKLIELPKSPYWGANIHVGFYPGGKKRYSPRSSKIKRDPSRIGPSGERLDKDEAKKVLMAIQNAANLLMAHDSKVVTRKFYESLIDGLMAVHGMTCQSAAPPWDEYSASVLDRHCRDVAPSTARSYRSKKSAFEKWLSTHDRLSPSSSMGDFKLADIQDFYDYWIDEGGASTTVNAAIEGISLVFSRAVVEDLIGKNPCEGVRKLDSVSVSKQPFTLDDLGKISRALLDHREAIDYADEWALAVRFAMFTGARLSDCIKLRWSDFTDSFRRVRFIPKKKERLHAKGKVDASVSLILPEFVASAFEAASKASGSEWVTPELRTIKAGKRGHGPRFREILDFAGVKYSIRPAKDNKGISQCSHGFHSFRGTIKTMLREDLVSAESNAVLTGHDDLKISARYITERSETVFRECSPTFERIGAAINDAG